MITTTWSQWRWYNPSLGRRDRDGREQTTNVDKTESLSKVFMCGVSNQKWPSNQITMFERTRQSAWLDAVTTPLTRSEWIHANICIHPVIHTWQDTSICCPSQFNLWMSRTKYRSYEWITVDVDVMNESLDTLIIWTHSYYQHIWLYESVADHRNQSLPSDSLISST